MTEPKVRALLMAASPSFPPPGSPLRLLGRFAGEIVEFAEGQDWA